MAAITVAQSVFAVDGNDLHYLEKDGEILITAEEVGKHLGYGDPGRAINKLYDRNQNELKLYSSVVKLTTEEQSQRLTRVFSEEGVYILSMLARTNEAKRFRARVALLLRRLRAEAQQRALALARESGYQQGLNAARALPELQTLRDEARAEGARIMASLCPSRRKMLPKAVAYREKGLTFAEVAKLLGTNRREVSFLLKTARALSLVGEPA